MPSIIILSEKSSGSSILQSELARHPAISHVERTEHNEHETLFWLKAAHMLRHDGFLPGTERYDTTSARTKLIELVGANVPAFSPPADNHALVVEGWKALCGRYAPVFLEKSPPHAQNWAALEVMLDTLTGISEPFLIVFLYRNPRSVLTSALRRWGSDPNIRQRHLVVAYDNMRRLQASLLPSTFAEVRYEQLVETPQPVLAGLVERVGLPAHPLGRSIRSKPGGLRRLFRRAPAMQFQPSPEFDRVCREHGY